MRLGHFPPGFSARCGPFPRLSRGASLHLHPFWYVKEHSPRTYFPDHVDDITYAAISLFVAVAMSCLVGLGSVFHTAGAIAIVVDEHALLITDMRLKEMF